MSRASSVSNSVEDARSYVESLASLGVVDKIFVAGSRSPRSKKNARDDSDWDFVVQSNIINLRLANPRIVGVLHADVLCVNPHQVNNIPYIVEVWPNDKEGVLG